MFAELIKESNVIQLIEEETDEAGALHKVVLRVLDKKHWEKLMLKVLLTQAEEQEFGVSIRKEYYLGEDKTPTFCWVLLVWGNFEEATSTLKPFLTKKIGPPPPPPTANIAVPSGFSVIQKRVVRQEEDGPPGTKTVVGLPHRAGNRNSKLNKNRKMGEKGRGAYVEAIQGDEGDPMSEDKG
jgi:hypothetical protein